MEKKILIFAATYNEAGNIKNFIEKILELNINLDLIKSIESDNSKFRKTVFNGMRGEE